MLDTPVIYGIFIAKFGMNGKISPLFYEFMKGYVSEKGNY
jgi:hypothetical protein